MDEIIQLTQTDRTILESYKLFIEGLANYLGNSYELVLHSLEDYEHSVIKIINGYHTGRHVGSPITDLALRMLDSLQQDGDEKDYISYFSTNKAGEPLKSTTIAVRGEGGRIIGLVCINFYMSTPYIDVLRSLGINSPAQTQAENFADNPILNISQAVEAARRSVEANTNILPSQRKKAIVNILFDQGVFSIKNSVEIVARELGLSVNTVYLHLRNLKHS